MIGRKTLCVSVPDLRENTLNLLGVILGVKERGGDARLPDFGANCFAVGSVVAKANRDIFVLLIIGGDELSASERSELTGSDTGSESVDGQRHHRRSRPQYIHASRVPVAQWRV